MNMNFFKDRQMQKHMKKFWFTHYQRNAKENNMKLSHTSETRTHLKKKLNNFS